MPESFRIQDRSMRNAVMEFIVSKRVKSLEYLKQLYRQAPVRGAHSSGVLWMNCVVITREDLNRYFGQDEAKIADCLGNPVSAPASWLTASCCEWHALGTSFAELLGVPFGGCEFVDAAELLMLEHAHYFAPNAAWRVLASRDLRKAREERALMQRLGPDAMQFFLHHGGYAFLSGTEEGKSFTPSIDVIVPALCSTLQFVYRKLCDYDVTETEESFKQLLSTDKALKHTFIGSISKQLGKLAEVKLQCELHHLADTLFSGLLLTEVPQSASAVSGTKEFDVSDQEQ